MKKLIVFVSFLVLNLVWVFGYAVPSPENLRKVLVDVCEHEGKINLVGENSKEYLNDFANNYMIPYTERSDRYSLKGPVSYIYVYDSASVCLRITPTSCDAANVGPGNPATPYIQLNSGGYKPMPTPSICSQFQKAIYK